MTVSVPNSSGTVGQTSISVQKLIDHGARRCGKLAETLTVEQVESSREALFYLLSNWTNKGLNLWAANYYRFGIVPGQKEYLMPQGTVDILNINYVTGNQVDYTTATTGLTTTTAQSIATIGIWPMESVSTQIQYSTDGMLWVPFKTVTPAAGAWTYYDTGLLSTLFWRVLTTTAVTYKYALFMSNLSEIPMAPLNRDDYFNLPNKEFQSNRPLQYFYEKQITPRVTLWPVGNDATVNVNTYIHSHIQDVGQLRGELAIPQRWYMAVQDGLAAEMSLELPGVDAGRIQLLSAKSQQSLREAEDAEADGLPIYFAPNISHYTR